MYTSPIYHFTMVDVIRYVSTQYLLTGVTVMMYILLIMTISLVRNANCSEGACVCLDGFVDYRGSGDYSIAVAVVIL